MYFKPPKNDHKVVWTRHAVFKMRQYGLSESRLRRLLTNHDRCEQGIVPNTLAVCKKIGSEKHPTEIWLMYQAVNKKIKIITCWRYPGISKKQENIPIPQDIKQFVRNYNFEK